MPCAEFECNRAWTLIVCRFRLLNQRRDVAFLLFYNVSRTTKFGTGNLLASSAPIQLRNPNDPQHVHLALGVTEGCAHIDCLHELLNSHLTHVLGMGALSLAKHVTLHILARHRGCVELRKKWHAEWVNSEHPHRADLVLLPGLT